MYGGPVILILLLVTIIGGLYHYQDSLLYYPEQPESARVFVQTPSSLGLPYENVVLTAKDGTRISAYFIKQPVGLISKVPTLLYFHGNAGNIGHRLHNAQALYRHCGFNILLVEYRGYGKSQGSPSEMGGYCVCVYTGVIYVCIFLLMSPWKHLPIQGCILMLKLVLISCSHVETLIIESSSCLGAPSEEQWPSTSLHLSPIWTSKTHTATMSTSRLHCLDVLVIIAASWLSWLRIPSQAYHVWLS